MKQKLNNIRKENTNISFKRKIINTILITLLGISLGLFSKWLDDIAIDNTIWWNNIIETLDLGNFFSDMAIWLLIALTISVKSKSPIRASINVFIFLLGMNISYHLYTIIFSGFNPENYMMIWYGLTIISPVIAYACWYSKSENKISIIISSIITFIMSSSCFKTGMWYVNSKGILYTTTFILSLLVVQKKPKILSIIVIIGFILSMMIRIPFISG